MPLKYYEHHGCCPHRADGWGNAQCGKMTRRNRILKQFPELRKCILSHKAAYKDCVVKCFAIQRQFRFACFLRVECKKCGTVKFMRPNCTSDCQTYTWRDPDQSEVNCKANDRNSMPMVVIPRGTNVTRKDIKKVKCIRDGLSARPIQIVTESTATDDDYEETDHT